MAETQYTRSTDLVTISEGKLSTTSLIVAKRFGKRHADVLRAVENLECSQEFRERNFALSNSLTQQGKSMPLYVITRDGFTMLAMGFTGAAAAEWKELYIKAFNEMEKQLKFDFNTVSSTLVDHLSRKRQIAHVKQVNGAIKSSLEKDPYTTGYAEYHTTVCVALSDQHVKPSMVVDIAKSMGVPAKYRTSGREALRAIQPPSACAASLTDSLVAMGAQVTAALDVAAKAKDVYHGMMKLGVVPAELLT